MHRNPTRPAALLFTLALLAGCGGNADPANDSNSDSSTTAASSTGTTSAGDRTTGASSSAETTSDDSDDGTDSATTGADPSVSPDFPYGSHFVDVLDSTMHYIDEGEGRPVLLLHGQPTSAYLWRNVVPHLAETHRVIAVDLIGFGKSGKPDIDYRFADHAEYLAGFIDAVGLDGDLTLVVHDWGSFLGFDYAMQHPEQIRGIAFMEAMLRPVPGFDFWDDETAMFMQAIRTEGVGEPMIFEDNLFIEALLPNMVLRELSPEERDHYRAPFLEPDTRQPMLQFPRELPINGDPADVFERQVAYLDALQTSVIPKLHIHATPGVLNTADDVTWARDNLPNLASVSVGSGLHFIQEDHPHEVGVAIADWLATLE